MPKRTLTKRLGDIVAQHEVFFVDVAARHPVPVMRRFLRTTWHPFFSQWWELVQRHGLSDTDVDVLRDVARDLSAIRMQARKQHIPVPPLARAATRSAGFFSDVWDTIVDTTGLVGEGLEDVWDVVTFSSGERKGMTMAGHHGGHHGGGHHHHGGGRRRRFGGGGWYGPAYGYWDWPYYGYGDADGDVYIDADEVKISGRHAQAAEVDAHKKIMSLAPLFVSGFFDSVKDAVLTYTGTKATNQFIKDNHLEPYVQMGAKAISTYYGGPAAGKASEFITPMMMSVGVKDSNKDAQAKAQLAAVNQAAAQHSPQASQAVQIAQQAAQKVATAYHVAQITKDAKAGNPAAQQALGNLDGAAKGGDVNAAAAIMLAKLLSRADDSGKAGTVRDPNWQVDQSLIEMDPVASKSIGVPSMSATEAAALVEGQVSRRGGAAAIGRRAMMRRWATETVWNEIARSADSPAEYWLVTYLPSGWGVSGCDSYAALEENLAIQRDAIYFAAFIMGASAPRLLWDSYNYAPTAVRGLPQLDIVGSQAITMAGLRAHAANEITALGDGIAVHGALQNCDGSWIFPAFDNADAADDWMGHHVNQHPGQFAYIGYFDATDPMWPLPQNDMLGTCPRIAKPAKGRAIQREPAIAAGILPWALGGAAAAAGAYYGRRTWKRRHPVDIVTATPIPKGP